jgi:hypothetical protein
LALDVGERLLAAFINRLELAEAEIHRRCQAKRRALPGPESNVNTRIFDRRTRMSAQKPAR